MTKVQAARTYFEAARQEAVQRGTLRDGVLFAFMTVAAALFAVVFSSQALSSPAAAPGATTGSLTMPTERGVILLVVPFLALGATLMAVQHSAVIEGIRRFVIWEHEPFMVAVNEHAPNMENSKALSEHGLAFLRFTSAAHVLILLVPSITALCLTVAYALLPGLIAVLWWFGLVATLAAGAALWWLHSFRTETFRHIRTPAKW